MNLHLVLGVAAVVCAILAGLMWAGFIAVAVATAGIWTAVAAGCAGLVQLV
jgi:hypothetical protein